LLADALWGEVKNESRCSDIATRSGPDPTLRRALCPIAVSYFWLANNERMRQWLRSEVCWYPPAGTCLDNVPHTWVGEVAAFHGAVKWSLDRIVCHDR
jgi:hypothetical protein